MTHGYKGNIKEAIISESRVSGESEYKIVNLRRAQHGGQQDVGLPLLPAEALVDAGGHEAGGRPEQHPHHHGAGHERAAVGGRQEAEAGEGQRDHGHAEHLHARAQHHRQQHALARRPEHVAVHQLPAKLFLQTKIHMV